MKNGLGPPEERDDGGGDRRRGIIAAATGIDRQVKCEWKQHGFVVVAFGLLPPADVGASVLQFLPSEVLFTSIISHQCR